MAKKLKLDFEPFRHTEVFNENDPVRFSISESYGTKHCISGLSRQNLRAVCNSFGSYEKRKWSEFKVLNSVGYTPDKNNREIEKAFPQFSSFAHFRIKNGESELFRVFGAEADKMFYVLWFDEQGKEQH